MRALICCPLALAAIALPVIGQDYPAKPMRIIVGFAPSGATDLYGKTRQLVKAAGVEPQ